MTFRRHRGLGPSVGQPTSQWEPLPHSAGLQLPVRIRIGADKTITQEVIDRAMKEFREKGRRG